MNGGGITPMNITLNYRSENNITNIEFIDYLGNKIGQLAYEINDNKAIIHDTYLYPYYRNRGILKSHFPEILSRIKQHNPEYIGLSVLSDEAKIIWQKLGFIETKPNFFTMNLK